MNTVSFSVPRHDRKLISEIARRAANMDKTVNGSKAMDALHHEMNITACHANGNRLRLIDLLEADDFNFAHDVFGIDRNINRDNGHLENLFSPRFSFLETR